MHADNKKIRYIKSKTVEILKSPLLEKKKVLWGSVKKSIGVPAVFFEFLLEPVSAV